MATRAWSAGPCSLLVLTVAMGVGAACDPKIQSGAGPGPGGGGAGPGGTGGAGGQPGRQDGGDGPGFGFAVPDGGAAEVPPAGGGGSEGSCAETLVKAQQVPVDLLVLLDNSSSMNQLAGMRSKWVTAQEALVAFVRDPRSAGLGVGVQFFPHPPWLRECRSDADCPNPGGSAPAPGSCGDDEFCVTPTSTPDTSLYCLPSSFSNRCPLGGTCQRGGLCSLSRQRCLRPGMPCPSGMPGDDCVAAARVCRLTRDSGCEIAAYQTPVVPIGPLPANEAALVQAITRRGTDGDTPTGSALQGVFAHLRGHLTASPGRRAAVILATDGLPTTCALVQPAAIAAEIRRHQMGSPGISTFVIGVFAAAEATMARPALEMWAVAGGTGAPFLLNAGSDLGQRLQDALAQIRGAALPCEFMIPASTGAGPIDFARVNVKLQSGGGAPETIPHVPSADRCDPMRGGWYYDVDPASAPGAKPTRIIVCPATCGRFKAAQNPSVSLAFGCKTEVIQ